MKARSLIPALVIAAACLMSCTKQNREMMYSAQETKIEKFVDGQLKSNPSLRVEYNGGSVRVVLNEGQGVELNARGKAGILYAGYDFTSGSLNNSYLFTTNSMDFALSAKWDISDDSVFEPLTVDLTDKGVIEGLRNGLEGVKEGEECYILFSGKHAFGKEKNGTIPANSPLAFRVWVQNVEN